MAVTFSTTVRSLAWVACEMKLTASTGTSVTPNFFAEGSENFQFFGGGDASRPPPPHPTSNAVWVTMFLQHVKKAVYPRNGGNYERLPSPPCV